MVYVLNVVNKYLKQLDNMEKVKWDDKIYDEEFEIVEYNDNNSKDLHINSIYGSYLTHKKISYVGQIVSKFDHNKKYKYYQCQKCGENIGEGDL